MAARTWKVATDGSEARLPSFTRVELRPGEWIRGLDNGGGGYGDPLQRDPARVLGDVLEGWVSEGAARDSYGVVFSGSLEDESLAVDAPATARQRQALAAGPGQAPSAAS
jgi:N-methylhydantoinase B